MFAFLRKIRKSLIRSGSAQKYLLYAIGEIILVVIGILIALQINNWNEDRKESIMETKVLEDLSENLTLNLGILESRLTYYKACNHSSKIVLAFLDGKLSYSDTLHEHFHQARIRNLGSFLSQSGFENFKNAGFNLLSSDLLKKELLNLFENTYLSMESTLRGLELEFNPDWQTYIAENFYFEDIKDGPGFLIPKNINGIIDNDFYHHLIKYDLGTREFEMSFQDECLKETQRVLQLIEDELGE